MKQGFSLKKVFQKQWIAVAIGNILLFVILAVSQRAFLQMTNIMNILSQCSLYGIMSVGMTFVISTGGIDISVGMTAFFTMTLIWRLSGFLPTWLIFIIAIAFGCIIGLCNGFMAAVLNFPDMIATLASMSILRGAGYLLIGSAQKFVPDSLRVIGVSRIGIVPVPMIIMLVIAVIGAFIMNNTRFGRYVLAVGGNKNSAVFFRAECGEDPHGRVRFVRYMRGYRRFGVCRARRIYFPQFLQRLRIYRYYGGRARRYKNERRKIIRGRIGARMRVPVSG